MRPPRLGVLALTLLSLASTQAQSSQQLHGKRQSAADLEIAGDLAGLPPNSTRYITRDELLAMPQVNFTVTGDTNFKGAARIRGVQVGELARQLAGSPASDMIVAICDDKYAAPYEHEYLAAHHPVLVLEVNGEPPARWPKAADDGASDMGPYMISNPKFKPAFKILAHSDEAQIPWGVVRLEFRNEKKVMEAFAPRGAHANDLAVRQGYRIALQNCARCHNAGQEGGQKSGLSWDSLAAVSATKPGDFAAYVHSPQAKNPQAQMPGNPGYDHVTLIALTAYFDTFFAPKKP